MNSHHAHLPLAGCPCCQGKAYFAELDTENLHLWQVTCEQCGLSTAYDDDPHFCQTQWNRRQAQARLKMWLTAAAALSPVLAVTAFLAGTLVGAGL